MLIIGLTGGIGSGKSTVSQHFESLGVAVIDADIITRELVAPNQPALQEIVQQFGAEILADDGTLDRVQLRQRVFEDESERKKLEAILHPKVRDSMRQHVSVLRDSSAPPALLHSQHSATHRKWLDRLDTACAGDRHQPGSATTTCQPPRRIEQRPNRCRHS